MDTNIFVILIIVLTVLPAAIYVWYWYNTHIKQRICKFDSTNKCSVKKEYCIMCQLNKSTNES